jgi:phenylalanyl-tRNA synthetase beta chain
MRLSLAWILEHIKVDTKEVDIKHLIDRFDMVTAEIEEVEHIQLDPASFTLVEVTAISEQNITAESPEFKKTITVPFRKEVEIQKLYLVKKEGRAYSWATLSDLGSTKEGFMPNVWCPDEEIAGGWKKHLEHQDYIITIDNKALTHRPDLWGHRGIAREMAAILNKPLKPEEIFLAAKPIKHYAVCAPISPSNPFTLEIAQNQPCGNVCKRLAGLYMGEVENTASVIPIAMRLARIDSRPLMALVDATNYVMFDIGQPMHAFDAYAIPTHSIVGRCAYEGEKLELLDGDTVTLTSTDYVLTDGQKPIALTGITGGKAAAVTPHTKALFIEAGTFDATAIRRTSARVKKRTEASTRFEKTLDPNQNTQALLRFLKLLEQNHIRFSAADAIASIGPLNEEKIIIVSQELIDKKIGMHISQDTIERILTHLGFGVKAHQEKQPLLYEITVPTFRATKDVTIAEDIVEEIARFVGYDSIIPHLPVRAMAPFNTRPIRRLRALKQHLAYGLFMHEVQTYAFYDEEFLRVIEYNPEDALRVASPLSEHWQRLITSLIPNILKCVAINHAKEDTLYFFEFDRVWFYDQEPIEKEECAGIFFEHKKPFDFYAGKALLTSLFDVFGLKIEWTKPKGELEPWYNVHQTADLTYQGQVMGRAGKMAEEFLHRAVEQGEAFIFELDADFLLRVEPTMPEFKPLAKYPEVDLDISMFVNLEVPAATIEERIKHADERIKQVYLVDFYQKEEWKNQKSVTYRFIVYDEHKTLTKDEIDTVWNAVIKEVQKLGAHVR